MDRNDSPPKFHDLPSVITVSEDLGAGQPVATIRASDPDTIGHLSFSLVPTPGTESVAAADHFILDRESGVLRLRDTLDRELKDVFRLTIRVSDDIQNTDATVTIQVIIVFL